MRERTPFPAELIHRLPNLRLLLTTGRRNAALDLPALAARDIPVVGTIDRTTPTGPDSTTQHCVAMILALARNIAADDALVKSGDWQTGFATGLPGKKFGVVGLGRLGAAVARIMHVAFGMKIIAWSSNLTQDYAGERAKDMNLPEGTFMCVSREELFSSADVVSLQLVLSARTRGLISISDLERMKPSALLVNTSRGPLINERDLLEVLRTGQIRGAALDVFDLEPLPRNSEWRTTAWGKDGRASVLLTPHMGYVEGDHIKDWYEQQVEAIQRWKKGEALENTLQ